VFLTVTDKDKGGEADGDALAYVGKYVADAVLAVPFAEAVQDVNDAVHDFSGSTRVNAALNSLWRGCSSK
jgi:hypothetical protein